MSGGTCRLVRSYHHRKKVAPMTGPVTKNRFRKLISGKLSAQVPGKKPKKPALAVDLGVYSC
jgi:hypothetical protein